MILFYNFMHAKMCAETNVLQGWEWLAYCSPDIS